MGPKRVGVREEVPTWVVVPAMGRGRWLVCRSILPNMSYDAWEWNERIDTLNDPTKAWAKAASTRLRSSVVLLATHSISIDEFPPGRVWACFCPWTRKAMLKEHWLRCQSSNPHSIPLHREMVPLIKWSSLPGVDKLSIIMFDVL